VSAVAWRSPEEPGADRQSGFARILLASEGRPFSSSALARATELAKASKASVHVLSIARVHGVAFGLPNPGLLPTKHEWDEQRESVRQAVARLRRKGIKADGHVIGTRNATKKILAEAEAEGCEAIVMPGDPDANRLRGDFMWTQEPQRVRRKAKIPVFVVRDDG
jgi:nucleotide-binding universal stress UspA family protein